MGSDSNHYYCESCKEKGLKVHSGMGDGRYYIYLNNNNMSLEYVWNDLLVDFEYKIEEYNPQLLAKYINKRCFHKK